MPIDFDRVPPRAEVPPPPQVSWFVWTIVLALMTAAGVGLTTVLWPAGSSTNTLWFWFCVAGYPVLAWGFLLSAWLGFGYVRRNEAIATNRVGDGAEQACHTAASRPLAILGHAWCVAADESENSLEGVLRSVDSPKLRPSAAWPDKDVNARWLNIPDMPFYPGNGLSETFRHRELCKWLLGRLIDRLVPPLKALPPQTTLQLELYQQSKLQSDAFETRIRDLIAERVPALKLRTASAEHPHSLLRIDAWLDDRDANIAHLLVAIELRNAISAVLSDGVSEAGVALLVARPRSALPADSTRVLVHRPAKARLDDAARTLGLAARWGHASRDRMPTVWTHGLTGDSLSALRQPGSLAQEAQWNVLEASVGDCSGAGPWLAAAFAAESACTTGDPQMVLSGEGDELIALVCRKQT